MKKSLIDVFGLPINSTVSIVGAGGKTTLMFRLATELLKNGHRVLTTTSTKIFMPTADQSPEVIISENPLEVIRFADRRFLEPMHLTAAARYDDTRNKLLGYSPAVIDEIWHSRRFDYILVEADGAAHLPLKAPAGHEPVIPLATTALVVVIGLEAVGDLLTDDHVFRSERYTQLTGLPIGEIVTAQSVCNVLMHPKGLMKGCPAGASRFVFLNKAETPERIASGHKIGQILFRTARGKLNDVLMGSLYNKKTAVDSLFPPGI